MDRNTHKRKVNKDAMGRSGPAGTLGLALALLSRFACPESSESAKRYQFYRLGFSDALRVRAQRDRLRARQFDCGESARQMASVTMYQRRAV